MEDNFTPLVSLNFSYDTKTRKKANKIIDSMDEDRKMDVNAIFNIISVISWRSVVSEEVELP